MANSLVGKVALVTAGSAVNYSSNDTRASELIKRLTEYNLEPTKSDFVKWQPKFLAIKADLSKRSDIIRLVDETVAAMGQLDVVVSNCGWTRFSNFAGLDEGVVENYWDQCFSMNVKSNLCWMHAAKEHLDIADGAFITTSSVAGVKPSGSSLAYVVSKGTQIHLIKALATIVGPRIRVNSISPGILLTEWWHNFSKEHLQTAKDKTQLKRSATVEDCADQVLTFAKDKSVIGTNAVIDSGFSL